MRGYLRSRLYTLCVKAIENLLKVSKTREWIGASGTSPYGVIDRSRRNESTVFLDGHVKAFALGRYRSLIFISGLCVECVHPPMLQRTWSETPAWFRL